MKIKVTKDNVTIDKDELYHAGEYNIHDCTFDFSEEYTDILVKKALFGVDNKFYEMSILNNQCEIPYDVLKSNGMVILGVYAYEVLEDKLKLRYSPMYDKFFVNLGSYQENIENQEEITSTQFEQYMQALQNGLAEVQSSIDKLNETTDNANNLIDDINKKLESGEFDGVGITTITSGQAIQQNDNTITPITVNKTDGSQQIFNVSAKNGINGTDGTDGTNGQDGITPNLQIGTVTTLEPNEQATVTRTGTDENPILNFAIPKGQTYQVNEEDLDNIANEITSNANSSFNQNVKNKTDSFNENSSLKTNEFNNNAAKKTLDYNNNCISKTNSFNQNSTQKLTEFNDNYTSKLNFFNSNADLRMDEYNANADNKIAEYDEHSQELNNKIVDTRNELVRVKNDVLETGTDTDTFIHLEDSAMAEYQELSVDGVCEQETTTGSQEFNFDSYKKALNSTYGNVVSGTYNSFTIIRANVDDMSTNLNLKENTKYYIKFNWSCSKGNQAISIEYSDGTIRTLTSDYSSSAKNGIVNFTTDETKTLTKLHFVIYSTDTNYIINNMIITTNSTATIEPYTGGQPSPNPDYPQEIKTITDSLSVTSCNKNLMSMNIDYMTKGGITITNNNDGSLTLNGTATSSFELVLATNFKLYAGTYTHSINKIFKGMYISLDNVAETMLNGAQGKKKATFELSEGKTYNKYFILIDKNTIFNNDTFYIQLEREAIQTSFEQHIQSQITANLPEGEFIGKINDTYKDTIKIEYNEEDGQYHLVLNKMISKFVLDGSENIIYYTETKKPLFFIITTNLSHKIDYLQESGLTCYCNYFAGKGQVYNFDDVYNLGNNVIAFRNSYKRLVIRDDRYINAIDFKNWLSTHNTEVYYVLETPYTVDLGVVDMPLSYDEITNIFTDSDLLPKINAKYYRNFTSTIQNLQVNNKALKQELVDINNRLSALETAQTSVAIESEVVE